ncbi:uncharacterized protein MONBRDRAFT_12520 [Monosiga brevicollis MX1]|uniref:Uncharacterized protein n=1 Tax=Monosiga brevicollis TaxID=81824 RepID=A9VCI9_MONBE|nr:uncharacterized protein MONBRDRAFT_12520 [Monosiga brevicollis MX1]EDQ84757.1 predicted protein [Monosiga brevicollis MX1]|eukprot:XP_001750407.1 hypothetical protein [Monosiga brevicollis MX1]
MSTKTVGTIIDLDRSHFIPVSLDTIKRALLRHLENDLLTDGDSIDGGRDARHANRQTSRDPQVLELVAKEKMRFIDFCRRLEGLYRCRLAGQMQRLTDSFQLLVPGAPDSSLELDQPNIEHEEDMLLKNLHEAMRSSNFRMLSQRDLDDALGSEHTLGLEMEIDPHQLDSGFLDRFINQMDRHEAETMAVINRNVLIYHRGVGVDIARGYFWMEKKPGVPPPITVRSFRKIPRADFEIVLPAVRPKRRSTDVFKILMALGIAIFTIVLKFVQIVEDELDENHTKWEDEPFEQKLRDVLPVLAAVGTYGAKLMVQYQAQTKNYLNVMTKYLYEKAGDTNDGVRASLLDAVLNQELKESIVAYYFLWRHRDALHVEELDRVAEAFLKELDANTDFEVLDAIDKLEFDKLIDSSPTDKLKFRAKTISRAITTIENKWRDFFEDPDTECPYCPYMDHELNGGKERAA